MVFVCIYVCACLLLRTKEVNKMKRMSERNHASKTIHDYQATFFSATISCRH